MNLKLALRLCALICNWEVSQEGHGHNRIKSREERRKAKKGRIAPNLDLQLRSL